ncbi:hypothetical protein GE061_009231 [Apolygus lucorum]|uniref:Uncharacterized protein n=1 Tax=Apolygus lucorum TaxID=248454 RepID=A0A6A4KHM9_APOLU|nr:hypothetical protein GE061_009231 [Apolygus lucorum]
MARSLQYLKMGLDFYHHICNTCLSTPEELGRNTPKFQSCAGCKLVSYCSRSHQKSDWREHKSFCMEVQKLLQARNCATLFSPLNEPTHQSLYNHQSTLIAAIEKQLKRNLTFCERSMIYFPDICGLCLRPNGSAFENLECLDLVFVGPDCPPPDEDLINSIYEKHSDKKLNINFYPGVLYHEMTLGEVSPNIIVAFNCGFHEFKGQHCDTWEKTIKFILTVANAFLVTTSYTLKEAEDDSQPFIEEERVEILKLCQNNPFKSLNPHRNPERSESAIFFFNQFLSVFKIKNKP